MVKRIILLLALSLAMWSGQIALAAEGDSGQIQGSLTNLTAGTTSSVSEQTIILKIYQGDTETGSQTAKTDPEGKFTFSNLSTDPSFTYQIETTYQDAGYYSQPIQFASGEDSKSAEIGVYDTTASDESVSVAMSHVIVSRTDNNLVVREYYLFINSSDRAFVGSPISGEAGRNETLKFSIPQGATDLQFAYGLSPDTTVRDGNTLIDTEALTPDGREVSYSYEVPITSDQQQIYWTLGYDIMRFDLLPQDDSIGLTSDILSEQQPLNISGKLYRDYAAQGLKQGDRVSVTLAGLMPNSNGNLSYLAWLAVLPIAGLVFFFVRRRKPVAVNIESEKERLLSEIAVLDDSYEDGEIEEQAYQRLRNQKKLQLMAIVQKEGEVYSDDGTK